MANTLKPKIILRDVPDVLREPLPAALPDEHIRAALASNYETALDYFRIDRQSPNPDQGLALCLLTLIFPAFDFKPKSCADRPKHDLWKLREVYRRTVSGEWKTSCAARRAEMSRFLGGQGEKRKRTLDNLVSDGKRADRDIRAKRHERAILAAFRKHGKREAILAMLGLSSSFFKPKK
jgi:hypothetical protein